MTDCKKDRSVEVRVGAKVVPLSSCDAEEGAEDECTEMCMCAALPPT